LTHFATQLLTGQDIALSYGVGKFIDFVFMCGFVKCIAEDDLLVRPECHGYQIFLHPLDSVHPYIFKLITSLFFSSYNIDNIPLILESFNFDKSQP